MGLKLAGKMIVRCNKCGTDYEIPIDSLNEETYANERNMGTETEYDFIGECTCEFCGNDMSFGIEVFEYPAGALDCTNEKSDGCELMMTPDVVIND